MTVETTETPTTTPDNELEEINVYSPSAVAEFAELAIQSIYRYLEEDLSGKSVKKNGKKWFPNAFRIGAKWMIPEQDVFAFLGHDPNKVKVRFVR